jgi:hypothetical protein
MPRRVAVGVLEAVKGFRRLKGHRDIPTLVAKLRARDQAARSDEGGGEGRVTGVVHPYPRRDRRF